MATSLVQRLFEGALHVGFQATKNVGSGVVRSPFKLRGYENRADSFFEDNIFDGQTVKAWKDTVEGYKEAANVLKRPTEDLFDVGRKGLALAGMAVRAPLGAAHLAVGAAADTLGMGANLVGSTIGVAAGGVGRVALGTGFIAGKAALGTGWALTKAIGPGVAKVGGHLAWGAAKDTTAVVGGAGKFLWNTRKNPIVGSAIVGGALIAGGAIGNANLRDRMMYGDVPAEYSQQVSNYYGRGQTPQSGFNPMVVKGAWELQRDPNSDPNYYTPYGERVQKHVFDNGDPYATTQTLNGPMGEGYGATGDLVFALNALRGGGIL